MRVTIACLLVSGVVAAQDARLAPLRPREEAPLVRVLDDAARRRRSPDSWVEWDGHFFQGPDGRTYVPYTLRLQRATAAYESLLVSVRIVGWNYVFRDSFRASTEVDGGDRVFRGAFLVQPGRCTVHVAVQDGAGASRVALASREIVVPGFGKSLKVSSVIVVDRTEPLAEGSGESGRRRPPYAMGSLVLVPARTTEFTRDEVLTVAFQVYNAATFEDGRPDVEVRYRVTRQDGDRDVIGATEPQLFDQETLPEGFSLKDGYQLTPVQSLPLKQFEPGRYRLQIEVEDHLGRARTQAEVPFTVTGGPERAVNR